jgi:hypothetical protein
MFVYLREEVAKSYLYLYKLDRMLTAYFQEWYHKKNDSSKSSNKEESRFSLYGEHSFTRFLGLVISVCDSFAC